MVRMTYPNGAAPNRWVDMITLWNTFATYVRARFGRDERGASLVEYALLVALIAVVCIVAIGFVGTRASEKFSNVASRLE
jgi:pilus assembly protein Flp/PilA